MDWSGLSEDARDRLTDIMNSASVNCNWRLELAVAVGEERIKAAEASKAASRE